MSPRPTNPSGSNPPRPTNPSGSRTSTSSGPEISNLSIDKIHQLNFVDKQSYSGTYLKKLISKIVQLYNAEIKNKNDQINVLDAEMNEKDALIKGFDANMSEKNATPTLQEIATKVDELKREIETPDEEDDIQTLIRLLHPHQTNILPKMRKNVLDIVKDTLLKVIPVLNDNNNNFPTKVEYIAWHDHVTKDVDKHDDEQTGLASIIDVRFDIIAKLVQEFTRSKRGDATTAVSS